MELKFGEIVVQAPDYMADELRRTIRKICLVKDFKDRPNYSPDDDGTSNYIAAHAEEIADEVIKIEESDVHISEFNDMVDDIARRRMTKDRMEIEDELSKWTCVDMDTHQYCRFQNGAWEFYHIAATLDTDGNKAHGVLHKEFSLPSLRVMESGKFAEDYLNPFDYKNLADIQREYGVTWPRIVAECIFETDGVIWPSAVGTKEYCIGYIDAMIKEENK